MDTPFNDRKSGDFFSVLTLNLRFGLADDGKNSWKNRKRGFPSLFRQYRPDFVALQEANDFQIDFLAEILPEYHYIGKRDPAPVFWQNNVIFYENVWNVAYSQHFFLSPTPSIPSRFRESCWPRQCTMGMFQRRDRTLICINTHFDFDTMVQTRSAGIIMDRLSSLPSDVPAILLGDFNANPSHPCHNIFTEKGRYDLKGPSFKNIFKQPFPGTYHGFANKPNGDHIDWILYRGQIIIEAKKVIRQLFEGVYLSDHYAIFARFRWK